MERYTSLSALRLDGLVTPVIRDAESKDVVTISKEARELIDKARAKKLTPEEMTGSAFTVTNLGMYGINNFYVLSTLLMLESSP